MTEPLFSTGPIKVVLDGTMTGVWAEIREECVDPTTNEPWERELGQTGTVFLRRDDAYPQNGGKSFLPFEEAPEQFCPDDGCDNHLANAQLWATAPRLYAALKRLVERHGQYISDLPGETGRLSDMAEAEEALAEAVAAVPHSVPVAAEPAAV